MPDDVFLLDAFTVAARDIKDADIAMLHALSVSIGWPHRAGDWAFLREVGEGFAAMDEGGRVHGSAMWFPCGNDFATVGMVITSPRLQANGGGEWLMRRVLERVQGRALGLHATKESHRLFLSLAFHDEATVYQRQGEAMMPPEEALPAGAELRALEADDVGDLMAVDWLATGTYRKNLIAALMGCSRGIALTRQGKLDAFALSRPFGRGTIIGPVVAATDEDAIAVARPLIADGAGHVLRIDTGCTDGAFASFLSGCGLPVYDTVTRMSLGRRWPLAIGGEIAVYALATQATG